MFKLKSKIPNENGIVHTYFEPVRVKVGIAECRTLAAKRHLEGLGFTEVKENEEESVRLSETRKKSKGKSKKR